MMLSLSSLLYGFFELCVIVASIRITYLIMNNKIICRAELITTWIIVDVVLLSSIADLFSFTSLNGKIEYVLAGVLLCVVLHIDRKVNFINYVNYLQNFFNFNPKNLINWKSILTFSLLLVPILWVIHPIDETDSLFSLNYILDWSSNKTNPYVNQASYVAFWELGYVPSLVLTKSDHFFWTTSFKSIILIGMGSYLVGRTLDLPKRLSWFVALTGVIFFSLWINPSGIGTLKNDMIFAAGVILISLAVLKSIKNDLSSSVLLLFTAGVIFVSCKYFGIPIILMSFILLILVNKNRIRRSKRKVAYSSILSVMIIMLTVGHYYVYHIIEYGDPFYPFRISELGPKLNGNEPTYYETSIMSSIDNPQLYKILLFTPSNLQSAGYLFPILLIFGILVSVGTLLYYSIRYLTKKRLNISLIFISLYIFSTWLLYFLTPYTAHALPGDFDYIVNLGSLRYVYGTLIITEFFFVYLLWRVGLPQWLIFSIIGVDFSSRLFHLYNILPYNFNYVLVIYPIIVLIGLLMFRSYLRHPRSKITTMLILGMIVFLVSPQLVEENRAYWAWWWNDVIMKIQFLPSSTVYLVSQDPMLANHLSWPVRYPVAGNNFQNSIEIGTEENLSKLLQTSINSTNKSAIYPNYIVQLCDPNFNCRSEISQMALRLSTYGYGIIGINDHAILLNFSENKNNYENKQVVVTGNSGNTLTVILSQSDFNTLEAEAKVANGLWSITSIMNVTMVPDSTIIDINNRIGSIVTTSSYPPIQQP